MSWVSVSGAVWTIVPCSTLPTIATGAGGGAAPVEGGGAWVCPPPDVVGGGALPVRGPWLAVPPDGWLSIASTITCRRSPAERTSSVTWVPDGMLAGVESLSAPLSVATTSSPSGSRPCTVPLMIVPLSSCANWRGGSGMTAVRMLGAGPAFGSRGGRLIGEFAHRRRLI